MNLSVMLLHVFARFERFVTIGTFYRPNGSMSCHVVLQFVSPKRLPPADFTHRVLFLQMILSHVPLHDAFENKSPAAIRTLDSVPPIMDICHMIRSFVMCSKKLEAAQTFVSPPMNLLHMRSKNVVTKKDPAHRTFLLMTVQILGFSVLTEIIVTLKLPPARIT